MDAPAVRFGSSSADMATTSMGKDGVVVKKRQAHGSSGGRRVFKEKKRRRLILSDSESDGDDFAISRRGNGSDRNARDTNGTEVARKVPDASGCEEKRGLEVKVEAEKEIRMEEDGGGGKFPDASGDAENRELVKTVEVEKVLAMEADETNNGSSVDNESGVHADRGAVDISKKTPYASEANSNDSSIKRNDGDKFCSERKTVSRSEVGKGRKGAACQNEKSCSIKENDRRGQRSREEERKLEAKSASRPEVREKTKAGINSHVTEKESGDLSDRGKAFNTEEKIVPRLDVADKCGGGEGDSCKKTSFTSNIKNSKDFLLLNREERESETKMVSRPEENGIEHSDKKKDRKHRPTREDAVKRVSRTEVRVKKEPGDDIDKKESRDGLTREKETKVEAKRVSSSEAIKTKEEGGSFKGAPTTSKFHHNGDKDRLVTLTGKKEVLVEANKVSKLGVTKKRMDVDGDKKVLDVSIKKNSGADRILTKETKFKKWKGAEFIKKETMELMSDRKRSRETVETETIEKKKKLEEDTKGSRVECNETGGKNLNREFLKPGDKRTEIREDGVSISKPEEKNLPDSMDKNSSSETEKVLWIKRSGARPLRKLKAYNDPLRGVLRVEVGLSQQKGIKVHGKGDKSRVIPSDGKKVDSLGKAHTEMGHEEITKRASKHSSIYGEGKVTEKSSSSVKLGSKQLNPGKGSAEERTRSCKEKTELEISPKTKLKNDSADHRTKEDCNPKLETCFSTEQNADEAMAGKVRLTDKQRLREQIKKILLDAGWKIDLRPRRGRDYLDAVYIPPFGGAGYWSVTKAYDAYVKNCKSEKDNKNKDISEKSSKPFGSDPVQEGATSSFAPIPTNLLSMLKRNVVNKRRYGVTKDKTEKKLGVRKKGKLRKKTTEMASICSAAQKPKLRARNQNKKGCALLARRADQDAEADLDDYIPYSGKRTIFSWMIDLGILHANGKVKYMNEDKSQAMMVGWVTRDGIRCSCCSKIVTVSKFEIHADSKLCQPYQNVYVEDTRISLLQCMLNAWEKEISEHYGFHKINIEGDDPNDDTCSICADGGDLICCDLCPSTFHLNCLGIEMLPSGDWNCTNCSCKFCGLVSTDTSEGSCSTISPLLTCSQCEKKYHQECIPEKDVSVDHCISDTSFCGKSCCMVFNQLQKLLGIKNDLEAGLSWRLIRRLDKDPSKHRICESHWAECNSKSAVTFAVMDECFLPIIDQRSGINLVQNIVYNYGSNIPRLSYNGFYTFILERDDEIIAAASVRIHGTTLAEMPFIGTRNIFRRQGMCRQLLNGIESALYSLNVEKLIIPAISELKETWVNVFGFMPLEQSQKQEVRSINLLVFPGTGLLMKPILKKESDKHHGNAARDNEAYIQSSLCGSDEVVVQSRHEDKDVDIVVPRTENFGVSHESQCRSPNSNSSEAAADVDDEFQVTSSKEPKLAVPSDSTVHADNKGKNEDAAVVPILYPVDGTSESHPTVSDHRPSLFAGNGSPVLPCFCPNLASDDEVLANPEPEVEVLEHTQSDGFSHKSECQAPDCKSTETACLKLSVSLT